MIEGILFENPARNVFLVDISRLLEHAEQLPWALHSCTAPAHAIKTPEPKGAKRDMMLAQIPPEELNRRREVEKVCCDALDTIGKGHRGKVELCVTTDTPKQHGLNTTTSSPSLRPPDVKLIGLPPILLSSPLTDLEPLQVSACALHNPHHAQVQLRCGSERFRIPPLATMLLSSIENGLPAIEEAMNVLLPSSKGDDETKGFDLVIADPPWPNRSVRRAGTYKVHDRSESPLTQISSVLQSRTAQDAVVGIWITNSQSIRENTLMSMRTLGFLMAAEWIWLKIAADGQPLYPLDGLWRRPYETCLLFQRNVANSKLTRIVIVGVPSEHSLKPCLKVLLEPFLPLGYHALELFARHLVAGWWSWGDEVLKFQSEQYWRLHRSNTNP